MNKYTILILLSLNVLTNAEDRPYPDGNPDKKGPGLSACKYIGDTVTTHCKSDAMSIIELPRECTSYFYDGLRANIDGHHVDIEAANGYDKSETINDLVASKKNVYVYYSHVTVQDWIDSLDTLGKGANRELDAFKTDIYAASPIKGLVLSNIAVNNTDYPASFTNDLLTYVKVFKQDLTKLQIGMQISATSIIEHVATNCKNWMDFQALSDVIDFFTIDFTDFNKCTEAYICTGIIPMDGPGNNLKKLQAALNVLKIPNDKIYYEFLISPSFPDGMNKPAPCFIRYTKICEHKEPNIDKWCADTTCSLREKGKFASENGAGFIAVSIDTSDRNVACKCYDSKYPTFFFVLDGWYDVRKDKTCPLINRIYN